MTERLRTVGVTLDGQPGLHLQALEALALKLARSFDAFARGSAGPTQPASAPVKGIAFSQSTRGTSTPSRVDPQEVKQRARLGGCAFGYGLESLRREGRGKPEGVWIYRAAPMMEG